MTCPSRSVPTALVVALFFSRPWIAVAGEDVVSLPMRDGVTIDTYVRTPSGNGPWPAVLKKGYGITRGGSEVFTAVLIDVLPDGRAMNVTEGIVRGRFRESIWEHPPLLEPGEVQEYTLELLPTARVFRKGHKIRLHLSSSRFSLWDWSQLCGTGQSQGQFES